MDCDIAEVMPSSHESVFHQLPPTPTKALNLRSKPLSTPLLGNVAKFHLQQNAQAYVPKVSMHQEVANDIRKIFNARHRAEADIRLNEGIEKYAKSAPSLAQWMENAIPEGLTIFSLPEAFRKRLQTCAKHSTLKSNGEPKSPAFSQTKPLFYASSRLSSWISPRNGNPEKPTFPRSKPTN